MQLKKRPRGRIQLAVATLGLLGPAAPAAAQAPEPGDVPAARTPWEFDTAVLVYSESDGRVQAAEPVVLASKDLGDDRRFSARLVLDALTGASPNGATPASDIQTFTRPSGKGSFTVAPGETPLDDTFKDTRVAVSADYQFPLSRDGRLAYGASVSKEYDFLSAGGSLRYTLDFNQRNTTLSAGLSLESDRISPVGGTPVPLGPVPDAKGDATESKTVTDLVVGVSQVLNPRSVVQFNYALSLSSGYQTDPYKLLSVVGADGEPVRYVYEGRPDSRTKHSLFARLKQFVGDRDVLDASYRFMSDDWGIVSSTVDATYRWNFGDAKYLEPHLRWYSQGAADFYRIALFDGSESMFAVASADPRLGRFDGITVGLKYGQVLESGNQWSARLEYYQQAATPEGVPAAAAGGLSQFELAPDLSAVMVTLGYRFKW